MSQQKLLVKIGPSRFEMSTASVNGSPTLIDTELFVGRVLVRVKDFNGITIDGSEPKQDNAYFEGRSRKFSILIEGKWKEREGVEKYSGDEVQFGSDFDYLPTNFPRGPFNLGFKIAHYIDEANTWVESPPNNRPYIMSPYVACMTSFCAYPSPKAIPRALLLAHHDAAHPHQDGEEPEGEGIIPLSGKQYWRFVGLRGHPKVDDFFKTHEHLLAAPSRSNSPAAGRKSKSSTEEKRPPLLLRKLGTDSNLRATAMEDSGAATPTRESFGPLGSPILNHSDEESVPWGAVISKRDTIDGEVEEAAIAVARKEEKKVAKKPGRFSLATLRNALDMRSVVPDEIHAGDLITGDQVKLDIKTEGGESSPLDEELGPWRFGEEGVDVLEDTTFVFLDPAHTRTVAARRKYFCTESGKNRKSFLYDPDIIYAASFFSGFCDMNTFDLNMGPVRLNIAQFFTSQPIRYTLRSTRLAPRPDGKEGPLEEEVFATISFQMVDVEA